jgi:hypothetical protein
MSYFLGQRIYGFDRDRLDELIKRTARTRNGQESDITINVFRERSELLARGGASPQLRFTKVANAAEVRTRV